MGTPQTENSKKDLVSIMVMFPAESDAKAMEVKQKIKEVVSDVEGVRFDFRITQVPPQ